MDDFGAELFIVDPFATPELAVATDHLRLEVFNAAEINETDGAVLVEEVIAGMRIGMERFRAGGVLSDARNDPVFAQA